jgi:hypothetical protein
LDTDQHQQANHPTDRWTFIAVQAWARLDQLCFIPAKVSVITLHIRRKSGFQVSPLVQRWVGEIEIRAAISFFIYFFKLDLKHKLSLPLSPHHPPGSKVTGTY